MITRIPTTTTTTTTTMRNVERKEREREREKMRLASTHFVGDSAKIVKMQPLVNKYAKVELLAPSWAFVCRVGTTVQERRDGKLLSDDPSISLSQLFFSVFPI
jgi:hypothetical protein